MFSSFFRGVSNFPSIIFATFSKESSSASRSFAVEISASMTAAGIGAALAIRGMTNAFMELDTAMARVRKTTGASVDEIAELKDAFIGLSKVMPSTASELADVGAVAGQLGIKGKADILEFTETASMMATAFDISSEEAATALAKLSTVCCLSHIKKYSVSGSEKLLAPQII